jgi:PDZ domain
MRILLAILIFLAHAATAQDLYVSVKGNDKNPGTRSQPFATLEKAKQEARKYKQSVFVYIMAGVYYLDKPLMFTEADSRDNKGHLIFMAYADQRVVIKGSKRLQVDFKPYRDGILQAMLPAAFPVIDQLFVNDSLQAMARYPNYRRGAMPMHGTAVDVLSASRIRRWKDPAGAYIHALHSGEWGGMHYKITGKDTDSTLTMEGGWQNNRPSPMHKTHRYIENVFEELDTTHEWYADRIKNILYYKPAAGININKAVIEVPVLENLIVVRGKPDHPVRGIEFRGLHFEHTLRTFMNNREPLLRSDWTIDRSAAILCDYTSYTFIQDCTFFSLGGNAVFFSNYNQYCMVMRCHIANIGASAICFVGNPSAVRSPSFRYEQFVPYEQMDKTPGPIGNDFPALCIATDNLIHDIGLTEKQVAGIQISMSQQITAAHNTIYNVPRAGINIGDGTWGGHDISYNDVFNTVLETGDHGAFNSWGRDRYWHPKRATMDSLVAAHPEWIELDAVLPTRIHDNRFRCNNGWDIDLDDGSSNYRIYNNVCLNGGLKLREGFHRVVENNIILNNSFHPHVWFRNSRDTFQHNIVSTAYLPIRITDWGHGVDSNFFPDEVALRRTQQGGVDLHSASGDPLFQNTSIGDYRVKPSSGALPMGFRNFDMDFGVISPTLKKLAAKVPLPIIVATSADPAETYSFLGMKVKNLNTLAERSATGMDSETGVLVLEVPAGSPLYKIMMSNDVILVFAGQPVSSTKDLFNARMQVQSRRTAVVTLFRDQKRQEVTLPLK